MSYQLSTDWIITINDYVVQKCHVRFEKAGFVAIHFPELPASQDYLQHLSMHSESPFEIKAKLPGSVNATLSKCVLFSITRGSILDEHRGITFTLSYAQEADG